MGLLDLLFLVLAAIAGAALLTAAGLALAGRWARAAGILRQLLLGAAVYFAVAIAVSALAPRREYHTGDTQCFDDWCIAVTDAQRPAPAPDPALVVTLRLSNRARRAAMGERGTVAYLTDASGRRYDPQANPADLPFATTLPPGGALITTRHFQVPRDARGLGLVYTHQGGFPIGWLVIGEGGWFAKPPIVWL